jgi:hypothetical protein
MADLKFDKEITALLVMDPYNDFTSEEGKFWGRLKGVVEARRVVHGGSIGEPTASSRIAASTDIITF